MTPAEIAAVASSAGFTGTALVDAVAVALAESSGNPAAVNVNPGRGAQGPTRDRGLWQINDRWHPDVTDAMAFDPATAAREAFRISRGGADWSPWAVWPAAASRQRPAAAAGVDQFLAARSGGATGTANAGAGTAAGTANVGATTGGYGWRDAATAAAGGIPIVGPIIGTSGLLSSALGGNPLDSITTAAGAGLALGRLALNPETWRRAGLIAAGAVLILLALAWIARGSLAATPIGAALGRVAP